MQVQDHTHASKRILQQLRGREKRQYYLLELNKKGSFSEGVKEKNEKTKSHSFYNTTVCLKHYWDLPANSFQFINTGIIYIYTVHFSYLKFFSYIDSKLTR